MTLGMIWTIILRFAIQNIEVEGMYIVLLVERQTVRAVVFACMDKSRMPFQHF